MKMVETSKINYPSVNDINSIDKNVDFIPISLRIFLRKLFLEKNSDTKIASIGQAIIQATRPRVLIAPLQVGLAVQMHHHFGSKFLIDSLNSHGFCSSYSEVKKFVLPMPKIKRFLDLLLASLSSLLQTMLITMSEHLTAPIPFMEWP